MRFHLKKHEIYLLLCILIISVFLIKNSFSADRIQLTEERLNNTTFEDIDVYLYYSKQFIQGHLIFNGTPPGITNSNTYYPMTYQYPPLYSLVLIPSALSPDPSTYIVLTNNLISSLTIIPLFLLLRRWIPPLFSLLFGFVTVFSMIYNIPPSYRGVSYDTFPVALAAFLFTCFIYYFTTINTTQKPHTTLIISGVLFSLLLLTSYTFFFLIPFIFGWIFCTNKKWIKKTAFFTIPVIPLASLWFIRNGITHGWTTQGILGGYQSFFTNNPFWFSFSSVPEKIHFLFQHPYPESILLLSYFFLFALFLFFIKYPVQSHILFTLLLINFLIWFLFLSLLSFDQERIVLRYIGIISPVYLAFALMHIYFISTVE